MKRTMEVMATSNMQIQELYNNFSHLGKLDRVTYKIDEQGTQFLELHHPDNFLVTITVPDRIFEWFIGICNSEGIKLVSDWDDGYDEPIEILKADRQKAVEDTVHNLLNHRLRFISFKKRFRIISTVQIQVDNEWHELISNSKLKLW